MQYPLPRIEDIFSSLAGGEKFSKIDLSQAYLQMEVEESSRKFLTINTHKGLYQYNRLVFGVASAPAIWQRAMDQVLQGIPQTQCYLDDIIVTGKDDTDHLQNLSMVLTRLNEYGLRAKRDKCEFFKEEISYCGHIIDKHGLHKSQEKIEAVLKAPKPENVSQLRSYLGLVNYYHKFLQNLASVLYPLNALLQIGTKWHWSDKCEKAFTETKRLITSDELLTHYDPSRPIRLACDASPYGIGAVLSHTMVDGSERPIAFVSRSLTSAERNYAQIDREALSLV
uniref:ribonuclease H n=1 Tax=Paramormyrops kingsleyae TaxID=1676925 RepID=A0A3B3Q5Y7_9TELE